MAEKEGGLTSHQGEILEWVKDFSREHGMPPAAGEMGWAGKSKSLWGTPPLAKNLLLGNDLFWSTPTKF